MAMAKKCSCVALFFVLAGLVVALAGVFVAIFTSSFSFNTELIEHVVLDEFDSLDDQNAWRNFLWGSSRRVGANAVQDADRERLESAVLHQFYVFAMQNMPDVVERRSTAKKYPFVKQYGPYGYREFVEVYDVRFINPGLGNRAGSDLVTFKSWSYYEPLAGDASCALEDGRLELTGALPACLDDTIEFTLLNRQFLQYIQEHSSAGVMGKVAHKLFAGVKDTFTSFRGPFLTSLRLWELPPVLERISNLQAVRKISGALQDVRDYRDEYAPMLYTPSALPMMRPLYETYPLAGGSGYRFFNTSIGAQYAGARYASIPYSATVSAFVRQNKRNSGYIFGRMKPSVNGSQAACCWCLSMNGDDAENDFRFEFTAPGGLPSERSPSYSPWSIGNRFDRDDGPDEGLNVRGKWHHVTMVIKELNNGDVFSQAYVDGLPYRQASIIPKSQFDPNCPGGEVYVGGSPFAARQKVFDGLLSDVRFYDRALSAIEVLSIYRSPSTHDALSKVARIYCGERQNSDEKPGQLKDTCPFGAAANILDLANATSPPVMRWLQTGRVTGVRDPRQAQGDCGREECGGGVCERGVCVCNKKARNGNDLYCVEWRALSSFQTHYLLDAPADLVVSNEAARVRGAPMDPVFRTGFHYWVNASEHFENFNHNEGPEKDAINKAAYETLIEVMELNDFDLNEDRTAITPVEYVVPGGSEYANLTNITVKKLINKARVDGLLRYFFDAERGGWINERATKQKVAREWSTQPVNTIACEKHSEAKCKWELQPFMNFLGIAELPAFAYTGEGNSQEPTPTQRSLLLSVRQARMLIDPAYKFQDMDLDRGLSGSLLNQQTVPRTWGLAYHYCDAWRHSRDMTCGGMRQAIEMGKEILPKYLAKTDLIQAAVYENNVWPKYKYELQTCVIADYVVGNWLMNNTWYDEQLAKIINRDFSSYWSKEGSGGPRPMTPARLPELGYMQWATSFYTLQRFGKKSLADMPDSGNTLSSGATTTPVEPVLHARFPFLSITDDEVDREPLEFGGAAILDGFPAAANFSIEDARTLLEALADPDSATRTNPRDTLGEGLMRGATELLIGHTVNISNMPQPDVYLRRKNSWYFNSSRAHAGWYAQKLQKGYEVLVGNGAPGRAPQRAVDQIIDGATNERRTFLELHQLYAAGTVESRWEDPNGRNLEHGYVYPSLALDGILSRSFATDDRQPDSAATNLARAARDAAWTACVRWRFCAPSVAGGAPTINERNATADVPFLVSLMLSMPGGERRHPADKAALAECRSFWGQDTLGGARLLDQDIHDCPDFWAFRNVLRLNATADYFGCDACWLSGCDTCIQVRWTDANGNAHDVLHQHFQRARAAFYEVAELFDEANRLTHAAEVPSDDVVVAIDTTTTSVAPTPPPSPSNLQPVRGVVSIVAGLKVLAQKSPQWDPLRATGLYATANGFGDLRLPRAQLVRPLKKRATILAGMMQSYVINGFFLRRRLWCGGDPKVCDYRRGGLFTTQKVRNYLFEGYTDTLFSELASDNFARHGFRYRCVNPKRIMTTWDCRPQYDMDCSEKGFELSIADVQTVTTRADNYQAIIDGNFTLSWNGAETGNISFSAEPSVLKSALEALSPIGTVEVARSVQRVAVSPSLLETRHGDLGYTWTITFTSEKGDLPLLKAPLAQQNLLALSGAQTVWSGSGDAVWVQKVHAGVHPGAAFEPHTVYDRKSARSTGEWYRRALTVPDLSVPGWACVPPCRRYEDARPTILLSNPAFTARDMWYGDNWHGATWRNEKWRREMNCARSARSGISAAGGDALSTIFYEYPLRYASCEHTARTGRLDARAVMQRVRHYGNESIGFWNGTEYFGNAQAVQHAADLNTSVAAGVVGGRDTWRQHTPYMFPGFMQKYDQQGDPGPLAIWNRDAGMRMLYSKVTRKFNNRPADEFDYSPVRRVELQGTQNLTGDVKISVNRYCAGMDAYSGTTMEGEPAGLLNLRPMSNSDLMIGPPHHLGVQIPWSAEGSLDLTIDGLYPRPGGHTSCVDIEPVTGQTLRYYLRRQYSYKVTRDALFPQFVHGTLCSHRIPACLRPDSNPPEYAEANYVPMFWKQESNVITPVNAWKLQQGVLNKYIEAQTLSMQALSLAGGCFLLGLVALWCTLGRRCCGCFFKDEAKIFKTD